jgi:hypothetical protein
VGLNAQIRTRTVRLLTPIHPIARELECNGSAIANCFYLIENKKVIF